MTNLELALYYAEKYNWSLFPAKFNPDGSYTAYCKWSKESNNDPNVIRAWEAKNPGCGYCVDLRKSCYTVLDVDTKNGKNGYHSLEMLQWEHGKIDLTLSATTPSGGIHYYLKGNVGVSIGMESGLDIPIMTPIPGGDMPGKGKYIIKDQYEITDIPMWLQDRISKSRKTEQDYGDIKLKPEYDSHRLIRAIKYISDEAAPAIEGSGGDVRTYTEARTLKEMGVGENAAMEIMWEFYNPRCLPMWTFNELRKKVSSAYQSKTALGALSPESCFEAVAKSPGWDDCKVRSPFISFSESIAAVSVPEWIVDGYIERDTVSVIYGNPGEFKSFLMNNLGLHVASGREWCGHEVKQGLVIDICGEGYGGVNRRLQAWHKYYKPESDNIPYVTSRKPILFNDESIKQGIQDIYDLSKLLNTDVSIIKIDTLSRAIDGNENDTGEMNRFLQYVDHLKSNFKCAVFIIQHTSHAAKNRPRGSSVLMGNPDNVFRIEGDKELMMARLCAPDKLKDGVPPQDTWFHLDTCVLDIENNVSSLVPVYQPDYQTTADIKAKVSTSSKVKPNEMQQAIIFYLKKEGLKSKQEIRNYLKDNCESVYNKDTFATYLVRALQRGWVYLDDISNNYGTV